ncbi:MAG TPA: hypothetical protein VL359_08600, partial [bacterium]|nr:hypothetical protein [bacterium]
SMVAHLAELQGRLRLTHLRAHLAMWSILSAEQRAQYQVLRGYATASAPTEGQALPAPAGHPRPSAN